MREDTRRTGAILLFIVGLVYRSVAGKVRGVGKGIGLPRAGKWVLTPFSFPNDATLAAHLLWLGSQGNLRTQTVKAFTEDEFRTIVGELS
jgi:hypothetical protein